MRLASAASDSHKWAASARYCVIGWADLILLLLNAEEENKSDISVSRPSFRMRARTA